MKRFCQLTKLGFITTSIALSQTCATLVQAQESTVAPSATPAAVVTESVASSTKMPKKLEKKAAVKSAEKAPPLLNEEVAKRTKPVKQRQAVGWVEEVSFGPVKLEARLDTGITSNQLNAGDLAFFKKEGATWARFRLHGLKGELAVVEKPLEVRDGKVRPLPLSGIRGLELAFVWPVDTQRMYSS
jgi:hypothetical protein